jgi:hypothetical protein
VEDALRYSRTSTETGIGKGEHAQVKSIDAPKNRLTVEREDGTERSYDPRRQPRICSIAAWPVSVSRGRHDAQIYTDNAATLGQELGRNFSHSLAIQPEPLAQKREPRPAHTNEISQDFSLGL